MKNNFLETPILNVLQDYLSRNPVRMHVPSHMGITNNLVLPTELYNLDVSEVSGYDTEGKDNPIFQSEKITADFFGVHHSFYLTGGASIGLVGSLVALRKFGKKVILARNVHKSVINGVILAGLEPIWLEVEFLDEWGIFSKINIKILEDLLSANKDIAGIVIVSPTYEGVVSDVKAIAEICHLKNIPLIVDEAHGAHLWFFCRDQSKPSLPPSVLSDADLVIQSWHKTLGSLTQTGVLHLASERFFTYDDIKRSLDLVSSTSPSFILLLSLELTRKHLAEKGITLFNKLFHDAVSFRDDIQNIYVEMFHGTSLQLFHNDDPLKIYLKPENMSGIDFAFELYKKYSIEVESANNRGFLMLIGNNFNDEIKNKITFACRGIACGRGVTCNALTGITKPKTNNFKLNPREAFIQGFQKKENNEYDCNINAPCPPGYVLNIPGQRKN